MVYSPLDALRMAKANPERQVIFFAIGFETTAPSTALTLMRAKAEGVENFSVMCNHVTIVPPLRALLDSPDLRLDGFIGPGHVCTVVGARPFEFIPADYGKPIVVSGFEPLDVLQSVHMILKQLSEGRREVENQYTRVVPYEGNLKALEVLGQVFELRPHFEWRGLGFISQSALKLSAAYADFDAEERWPVPGVRVADPKACQCGEVLKGVIKPWECKVFGTACTPGAPDRDLHGVAGGRLRRLLQLRPLLARSARPYERRPGEEKILGIIETARAKRPKFKDDRINMSHGAGGKATQSLIEGLFVPAFDSQPLAELGDAGAVEVDGAQLAMTTDTFVVKPIEFPGGTIGELAVNGTVNDLAAAGARPLALSVSLVLEEGLSADDLRTQVEAIAGAARAADVQIVAGDTKVVERGHADAMYVNTTGIGVRDPRAQMSTSALQARRPRAGLRPGGRARHGDHAGPRRVRAGGRDRVRHLLAVAGGGRADGCGRRRPALHARRDARRRGDGAQRAGARLTGGRGGQGGVGAGRSPRWRVRPSCSASTRCTWPTRAAWWPSWPRRQRRRPCPP